MKKDFLIAIGIGFVSGAIFALFAVNLPRIIRQTSKPNFETTSSLTPIPTQLINLPINLEVVEPKDESISELENIKLSGKTAAKSTMVIDTDFDTKITEASSDGTFSLPLTLKEGGNNISITAYDEKGNEISTILTVFYTKEKL